MVGKRREKMAMGDVDERNWCLTHACLFILLNPDSRSVAIDVTQRNVVGRSPNHCGLFSTNGLHINMM